MAAVSLKDLISAQQSLGSKPESMSIGELRKIMEEEVALSKAQLSVEKDIKATAVKDKSIQLAQAAIAVKTDRDLNKDEAEALKVSKELLENNKKMFKELQKHSKLLVTMSPEKAKNITSKALGREQFKTIGERVQGLKSGVKDFFTVKGFANKTGLVDKGSTGIIATAINRRAAKMQYAEDRMRVDPQLKNLKQFGGDEKKVKASLGKQFDAQQAVEVKMRANEKDISGLEKRGFGEDKIKRTGLLDTRESLARDMEKVDPRVRESTKTATKENETRVEKQTTKPKRTTETAKEKEPSAKVVRGGKSLLAKIEKEESETGKIVKESKKTATKENETRVEKQEKKKVESAADFSDETSIESDRQLAAQTDLLAKIEENTRPAGGADQAKPKDEKKGGGMMDGILDFITNMLGEGLMKSIKSILSPKNILKSLGKVFAIGMIVGAVFEGLMDGFDEFMKTGDIGKAIVAGLAGIVDFLTFGLFDKEKIKEVIGDMATWVGDHIVKPVLDFFTSLKDGFMNLLTAIKIPAITIPLPKVLGGDITLGPWSPFGESKAAPAPAPAAAGGEASKTSGSAEPAAPIKSEKEFAMEQATKFGRTEPNVADKRVASARFKGQTAEMAAPSSGDANAVYGKSGENAEKSVTMKAGAPVIVNAPTNVNQSSSQNVSMPAPIRNTDTGLSGYIRKNSSFI